MTEFDRTSPRSLIAHERIVIAIFRVLVIGIIILVLTHLGSAVTSLSSDFAGVVSAIE